MNFFADANIPLRLVQILRIFDDRNTFEALVESFDPATPDEKWIAAIAERDPKPVVLGGDGRILKKPAQKAVLAEADLMYVYLAQGWTNLAWQEMAWKFLRVWPSVTSELNRMDKNHVLKVTHHDFKVTCERLVRSLRP